MQISTPNTEVIGPTPWSANQKMNPNPYKNEFFFISAVIKML